jgi:hypothetical protein
MMAIFYPFTMQVGTLDKWEEDVDNWPELTQEEKEAVNKCTIM